MLKMKKSVKVLLGGVLLVCLGLVIFFVSQEDPKDKLYEEVATVYPEYSIQDLVKYSDIIATGEVIEVSKPLEIKPVGGGDSSLFTDYTIKLNQVIENKSGLTDTVVLRVRGGESDELIVVETDMEQLAVGTEYLFFLNAPQTGGGYTTKDDHMLLTGGSQGLLSDDATKGIFVNESYSGVSEEDIASMLNDPALKKTAEEEDPFYALEENLESGFITQEEYDETIKELSEYAEVVK